MTSATPGMAFRHLQQLFNAGSVLGLEDGQLLARYCRSNDPAAFEALVIRHGPMVLASCRAILRNEHDAEDAFQATFLVLARKAHSIRESETLGGWLHRVACRASVRASIEARQRRRREAEAAKARVETSELKSDLAALLHEEIDRLPGPLRRAVVLRDLEGLSYEEAASQLRCTLPSFRHRLAEGRRKLKARLTRRGAISSALPWKAPVVPAALARLTVASATGATPSAAVAFLAHSVLNRMLMLKIKFASAGLVVIALALAGVAGGRATDDPKPVMTPITQAPAPAPAVKKPEEMVEVRGKVVAADGKPVADAVVRTPVLYKDEEKVPEATSGPDGRFAIRLKLLPPEIMALEGSFPWLVALAPGHGIGWSEASVRFDPKIEPVVTLTEEGPPIEGRIIDLEGRPVAGASIRVKGIWYEKQKGDFAAWIARARNGAEGNLWEGLQQLTLDDLQSIKTLSGPDGRFKLTGVGHDRIADLIISGPRVATTEVNIFSRAEPEIRSADRQVMGNRPLIVHAPKFQVALMPSKRVEGVARDQDTGQPIAGLEITASVYEENSRLSAPGIEAKTDAEGRYRLDGLPRAPAYSLFVEAGKGLPYLNASLKAEAGSPALESVAFDFKLKRGVIVRGRVTDKVTGKPILGTLTYYAFADNPHLNAYPGIEDASEKYVDFAGFKDDGQFEFVALPGRGLVAVSDAEDFYLQASGFEKIKGYVPDQQLFDTLPYAAVPLGKIILAELVADPKAESMTLNLQADPGRSLAISIEDPDGAPLEGTTAKGISSSSPTNTYIQTSSRFEVHALRPGHPRRVVVMHEARKLIGSAFLKGDEVAPITIKLQPWGSVAGRIVDADGKPLKRMTLNAPDGSENKHPETDDILPWSDWNNGLRAGDDGRFFVEGLVPGLKYAAKTRSGYEAFLDLFEGVTVAPGEAKDLGDLKVRPSKP